MAQESMVRGSGGRYEADGQDIGIVGDYGPELRHLEEAGRWPLPKKEATGLSK